MLNQLRNLGSYYWSKAVKKSRGSAVKNCSIHKTAKIESGTQIVNTAMGRHSFCGYNCDIDSTEIGNFCSIASSVTIGGGSHPMDWTCMSPVFYEGRDSVRAKFSTFARQPHRLTVIGSDVWIGAGAIVIQGVEIGHGAVIGAGSIVTRNVPPYSIVAGNPAKFIRARFEPELIERLCNSEWWLLPDEIISHAAHAIQDPKKFLMELGR